MQAINGALLRRARAGLGITQEVVSERLDELCHKLGVYDVSPSAAMVSTWERGVKRPSRFYQSLLCTLYALTPGQLGFSASSRGVILNNAVIRREELVARPRLILVGGYAGSGKTELSQILNRLSSYGSFDKDTLSRPFTESLLVALGSDSNDRHTDLYLDNVRPLEYRALLASANRNVDCGVSAIASAPFIKEFADAGWMQRMQSFSEERGCNLTIIWVDCDENAMRYNLERRDAARDTWKLSSWEKYLETIDLAARPHGEHFVVHNSRQSREDLEDQARDILKGFNS